MYWFSVVDYVLTHNFLYRIILLQVNQHWFTLICFLRRLMEKDKQTATDGLLTLLYQPLPWNRRVSHVASGVSKELVLITAVLHEEEKSKNNIKFYRFTFIFISAVCSLTRWKDFRSSYFMNKYHFCTWCSHGQFFLNLTMK